MIYESGLHLGIMLDIGLSAELKASGWCVALIANRKCVLCISFSLTSHIFTRIFCFQHNEMSITISTKTLFVLSVYVTLMLFVVIQHCNFMSHHMECNKSKTVLS